MIALKRFILDVFQCVLLNDVHCPLKVELVDPPCISEFLQPFIHVTHAYYLLGERKEFLGKMRLCTKAWGAVVGKTLVLDALISILVLVEELVCALLWK